MFGARYLWLLLCYAQCARANLDTDFEGVTTILSQNEDRSVDLPVELGTDAASGCICRASKHRHVIVCFGNYECKTFPKIEYKSKSLRVRTTAIRSLRKGDLDTLHHLKILEVEANHMLAHIESGVFLNMSNLQHLSISYNIGLQTLAQDTFEGLTNLHNLTLVNNGFTNILDLTPAFKVSILPSLRGLDLSENCFEHIPEEAFIPMIGTSLKHLEIHLCSLDFIHPNSFLPLRSLKELHVGENDLSSSLIGNFLLKMMEEGINLTSLDISGMGFRKQPPQRLINIIAQTTIKSLNLAQNQFEVINDAAFPRMENIEVLDLRRVSAIFIGPNTFDDTRFPNLKVLLLGGNNLPGDHETHLSNQLILLDLSSNKGNAANPLYYEIGKDTFSQSKKLRVLNLSYNRIKTIFEYTFRGLEKLRILNLENGTIYFIGTDTFKPLKQLEMLNLANNPLVANENLTSAQFNGLNELKILILMNCGIKRFYDNDNIFEMMPNLTHLNLKNNQLYYITAETIKPLKFLQVLDLSENLIISWWKPLFLAAGVAPKRLYLMNNKISHFSVSMMQDISYLLEDGRNSTAEVDLMDNIFVCDCSTMYDTYIWLEQNGSTVLKDYFAQSQFQCSSPDVWEDRKVSEYLSSVKKLHCLVYQKISNIMVLVWTAPSLVTIILIVSSVTIIYRYRIYIRYWIFLAKLALGRTLIAKTQKTENMVEKTYKYDSFVSYCADDRDFVMEMVSELESPPSCLKLCVYERDFEIGTFISESIVTSINESRFIVLVISNSFVRSQWCRWETQLAEYHRLFLEDGSVYDPLVLIKIGEIDNKYLTTTLKYLLKTKIYHSWDEKNPEEFWKKLKNVLSKK
ncbi:toll-like receptor 2 isoform X1 [Leguminivora glycinivorella]|uniref:toll-like receptor 2 isoform X1 n=1 Tax=Leguminivora glycinivorella TaxID=1035111 RepID=UPI00200ED549|nr:toll-like receptor 2 isoform X1 [Leguminivora glycinivorella]